MAGNGKGRRIDMAHDRKRKDADIVQDGSVGGKDGQRREGVVCG